MTTEATKPPAILSHATAAWRDPPKANAPAADPNFGNPWVRDPSQANELRGRVAAMQANADRRREQQGETRRQYGPLAAVDVERVSAWHAHAPRPLQCLCAEGKSRFEVESHLVGALNIAAPEGQAVLVSMASPSVALTCATCGQRHFFDAARLGVVIKRELLALDIEEAIKRRKPLARPLQGAPEQS